MELINDSLGKFVDCIFWDIPDGIPGGILERIPNKSLVESYIASLKKSIATFLKNTLEIILVKLIN